MTATDPPAARTGTDPATPGARESIRLLGATLDGIGIGMCAFDEDDRALAWNRSFLKLFPEHDGHVHEGEPYRENLRRFYTARLDAEELPNLERYVETGIARHRAQTRPFEFEHRGRHVRVSSLPLAGLGRVRVWRADEPLPRDCAPPPTLWQGASPAVEQLRNYLLDNVPDALMICSNDGRIQWFNDSFAAMYGVHEAKAILGATLEAVYRAAWESAADCDEEAMASGLSILRDNLRFAGAPFELPLPGRRCCRVIAQLAPDDTIFCAHVDVSDLQRTQADLRATKETLEATLDALPDQMFELDVDGVIHDCHASGNDPLALPRSAFLGRRYTEVVPPGMAAALGAALAEAAQTGGSAGRTYPLHLPAGVRWFELSVATKASKAPQDRRFIVLARDVSERKRAEEDLVISEQRHRLLADNARDVIWTMALDGRNTYISPSVERVRGFTVAEAMRQSMEETLTPDSMAVSLGYFRRLHAALSVGVAPERFRGELEYRCKDGSTFWGEVIVYPVLGSDGKFIELLGVTRDISERKRNELQWQRARDAAEAASRAKSEFLAQMSHEIRTPMNAVIGLAQVLEQEPLTAEQAEMVRQIEVAGESLMRIINDILDFSKIEAGQLRMERRPFDLAAVLERVESLLQVTARRKGLTLEFRRPPAPLPAVVGDALRVNQVLVNLIGNGIKFTERGGVAVTVTTVVTAPNALRLRFEVRDTGIGIEEAALGRLFTAFTQVDTGTGRRFGGTGLGLSISKRLVEQMGGEIGAASTPGVGSSFWFEIPFAWAERPPDPADAAPRAPGDARPPAPATLEGLRVLAVDDNQANLYVVQRMLLRKGGAAVLAVDGQQALQMLRAQPEAYDVVLMDVQMPVMDGLTATRAIRSDPELARIPVIALTAGVLDEEREAAAAAGVNGFLAKPIDLATLVAMLAPYVPRGAEAGARA